MEEYNNVLYRVEDSIAFITLNRPKALNALNTETLGELDAAVSAAGKDENVKVIVITGEGRAFVAGADISQMRGLTVQEGRDMTILGQEVFTRIENLDKPVIAAVNGFALGGGCELAMACDIRVASDKAKFGQPEVNLGIIPGYGGTQRLPRLVGKGAAKYLIFTGEMISAEEAFRIGLADKVVPAEELMDSVIALAKVIMSKAPIAIKMAKHAINNGLNVDLKSGVAYEAEAYTTTFSTEDRVEGMSAFLEKRQAEFKNK
ncbi:MAG TPA: short-chain-enoyl-CoA hydratase [Bacillota bacterium]|jgi:enoyl-CoA hydratase|nr:short-chain-enoyl-CoA hydratase [Bacillota bacterium]HRS20121.1 short-chain-enoyl-CoA hydratase [Clostridia bacterium]HRU40600.1 short-chain-enoyl-CoA hydratase [Candidatus Diapherotrites archaeon]HQE65870.1 short-chain-enoyl-CoA hydratase [Bacillota bacterium]HQJ37282.1 short-chain-enoyl-CoA hydratase [Bacillota bacterium]